MVKIKEIFLRSESKLVFVITLVAAALGIFLIIHATNYGPWVFSDSTTYIWTARNLASGKGLVIQNMTGGYDLLTWHPPLFSLILSIPVYFGIDPLQAIRWINAFSFGLSIAIVATATWKFTKSFLSTLGIIGLTVFSLDLIYVFSGAMSEALFFVLGFGSMVFMVLGIRTSSSKVLFILAGVLAGLSYLTRYTGIAFVGTVILIPLLFTQGSFWKRMRVALPVAIPAILIPAFWSIFVFFSNRTIGGRSILSIDSLRLDLSNYINDFWEVLSHWIPFILRGNHIVPAEWKFLVGLIFILVILFFGLRVYHTRSKKTEDKIQLIWLSTLGLFLVAYVSFHIMSYIFSSAAPAVDRRLLSPVFLAGILFLCTVFSLYRSSPKRVLKVFEWLFLIYALITVWYFHGQLRLFLYDQHHYGMGYTSKRWEDSELVTKALELDPSKPVSSNNNEILFYYSGKFPNSLELPEAGDGDFNLTTNEAYLVLFKQDAIYQYGDLGEEYLSAIRNYCQIIFEDAEGYICLWKR